MGQLFMNTLSHITDSINLMVTLTKSTANHSIYRILNKDSKKAYETAMRQCIQQLESGWTNVDVIRQKIKGVEDEMDFFYKEKMFGINSDNRRYYMLACRHVLSIVDSIETRFITGGHDAEPRNYKNTGVLLHENKSIF